MRAVIGLLLLLAAGSVSAEEPSFSPLEMEAWDHQCSTIYKGNAAACTCLLARQIKSQGRLNVEVNLLMMVSELPGVSKEQVADSDAQAVTLAGSDEQATAAVIKFELTVDSNIASCSK